MYSNGTATKDRSGWGFTVKQGATAIPEDSAAYTVSTSSLKRKQNQSYMPYARLPEEVAVGKPKYWHVSMFDVHFQKRLWRFRPEHTGVKGTSLTEHTDWTCRGEGNITDRAHRLDIPG